MSSSDLVDELAALGPFFAVDVHLPGEQRAAPWLAASALLVHGRLERRIDAVRAALARGARKDAADIEFRVAVSVTQLGLVARLLAPAIGASAIGLGAVALTPDDLWWQDELGGRYPVSLTIAADRSPNRPPTLVDAITDACVSRFGVSPRVLWGNVGSAANSAAQLVAVARPDLTRPARAAADLILADPRVDGGLCRSGPGFTRNSCCLIYRVGGTTTAVCGDCVLGRRITRS